MGQVVQVTDLEDDRLRLFVKLRDTQLRHHLETEAGIFIAEGTKIIERAFHAGYRPRAFLLTDKWLAQLSDIVACCDADIYQMSEAEIECLTGFHVHRGALAAFERTSPAHCQLDLNADDITRIVVCEDIVDHTNLGAIIRSAAGLGWNGVAVSHRSADPLYRRAIKASMGTVFSLPWLRFDQGIDPIERLHQAGFTTVAFALTPGAIPLEDYCAQVRSSEKIALLVGTEGAGLSHEWIAVARHVVTIPMQPGIDSLNVAVATGIGCYQLRPRP